MYINDKRRLFNRLTRKPAVQMVCNMNPFDITSRLLIITWISESNKTAAQI